MLVALEGIDGVGKSTQARMLREHLTVKLGHDVRLYAQPSTDTDEGREIRRWLQSGGAPPDDLAELFAADRLKLSRWYMKPAMMRGLCSITDRHILSSLIYQGQGDEAELERIWRLNAEVPIPDVTILLTCSVERITSRLRDRPEHREVLDTVDVDVIRQRLRWQEAARRFYEGKRAMIVTVDGDGALQAVADRVRYVADTCIDITHGRKR